MLRYTIFSDDDFLCTVQIKQQQLFVPKQKADMYEAEKICKHHNSSLYVYNDKNNVSMLIEKLGETECTEEYFHVLNELYDKSSKNVVLIQIEYEKISLKKKL